MKIESVMTRDPVFCLPDEGVVECAKLMAREDVGLIPVVESRDTRRLVGVVTDRDLCLGVVAEGRDPETVTIENCMTDRVVTCRPEDELEVALDRMREHRIRRIVVVDETGCCVGVVAQADVVKAAPAPEVKETIAQISKPTV